MAILGNPTKYQDFPVYETVGNGTTTTFALPWTPGSVNNVDVFVGGSIQSGSYAIVGATIVFNSAPANGEKIIVKSKGLRSVNPIPKVKQERKVINATAGQTVFNTSPYSYQVATSNIAMYVNGSRWVVGEDFTETSSTTVTSTSGYVFDGTETVELVIGNDVDGRVWTTSDVIAYQPAGVGAVQTDVQSKLREFVSVEDYGASTTATPEINAIAIQTALDRNAGIRRVYLPELYIIDRKIRIPSNTYLYGNGAASGVKMHSSVGRDITVVQTGTRNDKRTNILIENLSVDFNRARWQVSGGGMEIVSGETLNTNGIALNICYSENVIVRNVTCIDGWKHSLDVQAPRYVEGTNGATYDPQPSRFVWIDECIVSGGGDDNVTTHHSSDIWFTGCKSINPSGVRTGDNSNCYEIDDGSRNVFMSDNVAIGGVCGLQIKGHNYAPAPYNVIVSGLRCINNALGVEVRHTGWYADDTFLSGNGSQTLFTIPQSFFVESGELYVYVDGVLTTAYTLDSAALTITFASPPPTGTNNIRVSLNDGEVLDEDGNPILYTGASPTARNITLNDIEIIAPRSFTNLSTSGGVGSITTPASYALRIRSYENVTLSNIRVNDGSLDIAGDYLPATPITNPADALMRIYNGARNFNISNISIYGFSYLGRSLAFTGSARGTFNVDGFVTTNGPTRAIRAASGQLAAYRLFVDNVIVNGVASPTESAPVFINLSNSVVGKVHVTGGYTSSVSGDISNIATNLPNRIVRRRAKSSGDLPTSPHEIDVFVWEEGVQDLGVGEGIAQVWKARIFGEQTDRNIGLAGFRKPIANDNKVSDYFIQVAPNASAEPQDVFVLSHTGVQWSKPLTVATLPSPSLSYIGVGARSFVTDANATTFNSIVAGGGSNSVPVFSDGTNWRIG
jgi:hypothetical protein